MRPLVVDYLKNRSFGELYEHHGVKARFSKDETKVSLNYDQLAIKGGDKLAEQCRGLIVRPLQFKKHMFRDDWERAKVGECDVVAWPMDRFYNDGDTFAASIDWKTALVQEKLDGTMCILYFDRSKHEWHVATRSVCEADMPLTDGINTFDASHVTFRTLFERGVVNTLVDMHRVSMSFDEWTSNLDRSVTYVYELTSPANRIVVKYDDYRAWLLAMRVTATGEELHIGTRVVSDAANLNVPSRFTIKVKEDLIAFVRSAKPDELEGCVVLDNNFNRIKIKNPTWVLASRAKDFVTTSPRNGLECIIDGTVDDIKPIVSQDIVRHLEGLEAGLKQYDKLVMNKFNELKLAASKCDAACPYSGEGPSCNEFNRKIFALLVKALDEWQAPYFAMLDPKNGSLIEWLRNLKSNEKLLPSTIDAVLAAIRSL